jgi:hypothetical protein
MKRWMIASGAIIALLVGLLLFFRLSPYGFVYITGLYWLCCLCGLHLLVALTVWLCREKLRRRRAKALLIFASALCAILATLAVGLTMLIAAYSGDSALFNSYMISRSPAGTNRVIVYSNYNHDALVTPMANRWIYHRDARISVGSFVEHIEVEWISEHLAMARYYDAQVWDAQARDIVLMDGVLTLEFPQ